MQQYFRRDGSSVRTGSLNMGGFSASNVAKPVSEDEVVTRNYVDNTVNISLAQCLNHNGSSPVTGALNMGGYSATNVTAPVFLRVIL
jgi:hypothetical protein